MTIYSNDNLEARAPRGLDAKMFVGAGTSFLYDTKEDIPSGYRYQGMIVYEVPDSISHDLIYPIWQLKGGIEDTDWIQINTSAGGGTQGLIQTDIYKEIASGYVDFFSLPGGYKQGNTLVFINGVLVTNDTNVKPETDYAVTDHVTWSALQFVVPPETGDEVVVVKDTLYLT